MNRLSTILMVICALSGCATQPAPTSTPTLTFAPAQTSVPTTSPAPEPDTFESLEGFQTALAQAIENNAIDTFWDQVVAYGPGPLVYDDTAVFIYRGEPNKRDEQSLTPDRYEAQQHSGKGPYRRRRISPISE